MNKSKSYRDDIRRLVEHHGKDKTLVIAIEECSELIKEITKYKRAGNHEEQINRRDGLLEEIADVQICIDMLQVIFDIAENELAREITAKMQRNIGRMME